MPVFISRMAELLVKYLRGELTAEENIELDQVINESEENKQLFKRLTDANYVMAQLNRMSAVDPAPGWEKIVAAGIIEPRKIYWWRYAAAAIVFCLIVAVYYWSKSKTNESQEMTETKTTIPENTKPVTHNRGYLILANNKLIRLDTVADGSVAYEGNTRIEKAGKHLSYLQSQNSIGEAYNSLVAEKGGDFRITLADSTTVWLNAESSIRFPVSFTGNERNVEINGEAYFEVTKNTSRPFNVKSGNVTIEVLGTHFNVKAHAGMPSIKTTLLKGSVKINTGNKTVTLSAGEEVEVTESGMIKNKTQADLEQVTAWKEGTFEFKQEKLSNILAELGRWYNLEVEMGKNVRDKRLTIKSSRERPVQDILDHLSAPAEIQYRLEANKIIVF